MAHTCYFPNVAAAIAICKAIEAHPTLGQQIQSSRMDIGEAEVQVQFEWKAGTCKANSVCPEGFSSLIMGSIYARKFITKMVNAVL